MQKAKRSSRGGYGNSGCQTKSKILSEGRVMRRCQQRRICIIGTSQNPTPVICVVSFLRIQFMLFGRVRKLLVFSHPWIGFTNMSMFSS